MDNKDERIKQLEELEAELFNFVHTSELIVAIRNKRLAELEEVAMELYELVHESDLAQNKIRANELYHLFIKDNTNASGTSLGSQENEQ